ncbi:hypothetical protein JW979_03670 [bacterium]|nr:hypothetical protein [candidate division CSSED10-310 bacterium]
MNCETLRELILSKLDSYAHGSDADIIQAHLKNCPECQQYVDLLKRSLDILNHTQAPEPSPRQMNNMWDEIASRLPVPRKSSWRLVPAYALVAVVCFAAGYALKSYRETMRQPATFNSDQDSVNCTALFDYSYPVNPYAIYLPHEPEKATLNLSPGNGFVSLPGGLTSHGPYAAYTGNIETSGGAACIPFVSPYGHVIVLQIKKSPETLESGSYQISSDRTKVLLNRITWAARGWVWTMEGRVPPDYLLDLAQEMTEKTQI